MSVPDTSPRSRRPVAHRAHSEDLLHLPPYRTIFAKSAARYEALFHAIRNQDADAAQAAGLGVVEQSEKLLHP